MPTFCRHNRLIQNCPICSREQSIELRPVVSSSAPRATQPRQRTPRTARAGSPSPAPSGIRVRRMARGVEDGYHSPLVPGLHSTQDAARLADELAFAATRLRRLAQTPPGLYAEVARAEEDLEERTWLAFLIAYLCPLDGEAPFAGIEAVRVPWSDRTAPVLEDVPIGPRAAHDPGRGTRTLDAYRSWADRQGSQASAILGELGWTPERRFERVFERLALPGLQRDAKFDLLVTLGQLGLYELRAGRLALGGVDEVTVAAKRALGIGDPLLLERRARELADACQLPLEALDVGLYNWGRGERATLGLGADASSDPDIYERVRAPLGV